MRRFRIKKKAVAPYLFCLPFFIVFFVVYLYPFIQTIVLSFQKVNLMGTSILVGWKNYKSLLNNTFLAALTNTFSLAFFYIITIIPLSVLLALTLNRKKFPGRNFFKSAFFIPVLASTVIAGVLFRLMFASADEALFNSILIKLGILKEGVSWLYDTRGKGVFVLVLISLWRNVGINIVFCLAGLQNIPHEQYDAARIDGANKPQLTWYITLPGLRPTLVYILTMSIMQSLSSFTESYILWRDATANNVGLTIVRYLYNMGFYKGNFGVASAVGIVLLLIIMVINIAQLSITGLFKEE